MTRTTSALTAIEIVALAKLLTQTEDKDLLTAALGEIPEGTHTFDLSLDLSGSFDKGADRADTATVAIPFTVVVGLLLRRMGATREAAITLLAEVLPEAIAAKGKAKASLLAETGVTESLDRFKNEVVNGMPKIHKTGSIKMKDTEVVKTRGTIPAAMRVAG